MVRSPHPTPNSIYMYHVYSEVIRQRVGWVYIYTYRPYVGVTWDCTSVNRMDTGGTFLVFTLVLLLGVQVGTTPSTCI